MTPPTIPVPLAPERYVHLDAFAVRMLTGISAFVAGLDAAPTEDQARFVQYLLGVWGDELEQVARAARSGGALTDAECYATPDNFAPAIPHEDYVAT